MTKYVSWLVCGLALAASTAWADPPVNDNFADRIQVSGTEIVATGDNYTATREPGEPNHNGTTNGNSVWWTWTAPAGGAVTFSTGNSDFDTWMAIYTGTNLTNLVLFAKDHNTAASIGGSRVITTVASNTTYQIAIEGTNGLTAGGQGSVQLNISLQVAPVNDNFTNRTVLTGMLVVTNGTNLRATKEPGEPKHLTNDVGGKSVWWTW